MSRRRVVKVGGSCLANPQLVALLTNWLARQQPAENWIVVGGGECIEAMRELAARFALAEETMHWRCVGLLRATFEILGELFPDWEVIESAEQFQRRSACEPAIGCIRVAVDTFYRETPGSVHVLPVGWETTTDAIAAYLAGRIAAAELVLLKSCAPELLAADVVTLSQRGIVDAALPAALPQEVHFRIETLC
jgi:aspartokinase-like uncharacterized kinase